jgi:hypothetical protein
MDQFVIQGRDLVKYVKTFVTLRPTSKPSLKTYKLSVSVGIIISSIFEKLSNKS